MESSPWPSRVRTSCLRVGRFWNNRNLRYGVIDSLWSLGLHPATKVHLDFALKILLFRMAMSVPTASLVHIISLSTHGLSPLLLPQPCHLSPWFPGKWLSLPAPPTLGESNLRKLTQVNFTSLGSGDGQPSCSSSQSPFTESCLRREQGLVEPGASAPWLR